MTAIMGSQMGKALALDTPLVTPTGWTTMGEVRPGDVLFDDLGQPCSVLGKSHVQVGRQCYRVEFSDGATIIADAEHLWEVYDRKGRRRIRNTEQIRGRLRGSVVSDRVAVAGPLVTPSAELPIDPYVLGAWLGDGNSQSALVTCDERDGVLDQLQAVMGPLEISGRDSRRPHVVQVHLGRGSATHERVCSRGHEKRRYQNRWQCGICIALLAKAKRHGQKLARPSPRRGGMAAALADMGMIGNKHIPAIYSRASIAQRWSLLQGLMDTDGSVQKNGSVEFAVTCERLAIDTLELMVSLGLKVSLRRRAAVLNGRKVSDCWRLRTTAYSDQPIFRLSRKQGRLRSRADPRCRTTESTRRSITAVVPVESVPVQCISVDSPSRLYLAGRAMIPTHNTEALFNVIGHKLDDDPAPILYFGPTKSNIDGVIEPRVAQMLRSAPSLWGKTLHGRRAQKLVKRVAGVTLRLAWAGSPTELASQPAHTVLADEVDRMEPIPGEGDPLTLAEARIATYPDGRLIVTSTPTEGNVETYIHPATGIEHWKVAKPEDIASPSWRLWQEGTRYEWAVPCPECDEYFVPRFKLLWWPKGATARQALRESRLTCARCGTQIEDHKKTWMNERGHYLAPGQKVENGVVVGEPPEAADASFWASALMSPWVTFGRRASDWIKAVASGDPDRVRGVLNTAYGELYRVGGEAPPWQRIRDLCGEYVSGHVPAGVESITAFVDVQKDRLVYVIRGWGAGMQSWLIEAGEMWGDTELEDVWQQLGEFRDRRFGERELRIKRLGIDSGYRPGDVKRTPDNRIYEFCRRYKGWALPTKGRDRMSKPLSPSLIDVTVRGKVVKNGLQIWHLDTDFFKSWVYARFEWPRNEPGGWSVPQDVTDDYCQQVTAEARVLKPSGHAVWLRVRKDNHYLDCEAGAVAMAYSLGLHARVKPKLEVAAQAMAAQEVQSAPPPVVTRRLPSQRFQRKGWFGR